MYCNAMSLGGQDQVRIEATELRNYRNMIL